MASTDLWASRRGKWPRKSISAIAPWWQRSNRCDGRLLLTNPSPGEMKICLLTPGQPSTNPRLVKEADALATAGFDVTVVYAHWESWATKADAALLATRKWSHIRVGGD